MTHRKKTQLSLISRFAAEIESSRAPDLMRLFMVWGIGLRLYLTKKVQTQVSEPEPSWAEQQTMLAVAEAREDSKPGLVSPSSLRAGYSCLETG